MFAAEDVILHEGADTDTFGIVLEGRVALRLLVPERGAVTVMTVEPGDVVGWSALVPPYRATSTAVAVEPTRLLAFESAPLRKALQEDPALAATVYPRVLEAVARRLGATRHQLLDLYGRDVEIQFVSRIRGMAAFEGVDALIAQITDDVRHVRTALA